MIFLIPLFIVLDLLCTLVAVTLVNWWAPLFAFDGYVSDRGMVTIGPRLPNWLRWFDTFDGTLDAGLRPGEVSSYWTRMRCLYRNPACGFSYWALGEVFDSDDWVIKTFNYDNGLTFLAVGPDWTFNLVIVRFGVRLKLGWKAWNYLAMKGDQSGYTWSEQPWGPEMQVPFVFSLSLEN